MAKIQGIRGMNDILPEQSSVWRYLEATVEQVVSRYAYSEIRLPIVEKTELFKRSIGEVTDIVEKEMYTFNDRNDESLTLRPEGTASCVRACEEHGLLYNQTQRLWYKGPMFRYEKPQKGRYRQFHQIGVETFGMESAEIDAEVIMISARIWRELGLSSAVTLQINSLGSNEARETYKAALVDYLSLHVDQLDEDSKRRLATNPLRVLDSKESATQAVLENAPLLADYLDSESKVHFASLMAMLDQAGITYEVNQRLVRGLDYYSKTVFEWVTDKLGAQGTVCAGGRYDGLVKQLGGRVTPAVGFAMGIERLVLLLETLDLIPAELRKPLDLYLAAEHKGIQNEVVALAERLRNENTNLRVMAHFSGLKNINAKARQTDAEIIVLLKSQDSKLSATLWHNDEPKDNLSIDQLCAQLATI